MTGKTASGVAIPEDLVLVGHITGAYGIQGWVRIKPYSADADALLHARTWWLDKPEMRDVEVQQAKDHSGDTVARLVGVADRNAAEALKGAAVSVSRRHFPALDEGEFYWIDLIGLAVENLQGEALGQVADMMDNGAHPILRVAPPVEPGQKPGPEMLIPYVGQFVQAVDLAGKKITVDWGRDY
ncbi:ribosome maturation factor RimM [Janthinobacterium sp. 17J80-10]|uniref:ribosome maturation factor RimM n=1 Tax=Janthinobacterium sp. 17J80-10 TaxID=2497863 RepID=UPI00100583D0|nr:ribosome maturation factor RimM [Janthinobacterium sp. 17J80-10]QAU33784.1 ribosome maturation factor RimM [Janthinobacterium sp. 17J80-10]